MTNVAEHPLAIWAWLITISVLVLGVIAVMIWDSAVRASKTIAQPPSVGTVRGTITLDTAEFDKQMARVRAQAEALKAKYPAAHALLGGTVSVQDDPPASQRGRTELDKHTDQAIEVANS